LGILRHSPWDALLVGLALLHGALLVLVPSVPLIALGLWWNGNTISHNFVHLPFFRSRAANVLFAAYLSLLLGFPQSLWAARHLAHHRDEPFRWKPVRRVWLAQVSLVLALWALLFAFAPKFFLAVYLPGWLLGLGLCHLQGRFEHARGTVSHYGWLYNWLFFNDGFHVEHHARPARH
jgi:fatty acid desaturase